MLKLAVENYCWWRPRARWPTHQVCHLNWFLWLAITLLADCQGQIANLTLWRFSSHFINAGSPNFYEWPQDAHGAGLNEFRAEGISLNFWPTNSNYWYLFVHLFLSRVPLFWSQFLLCGIDVEPKEVDFNLNEYLIILSYRSLMYLPQEDLIFIPPSHV